MTVLLSTQLALLEDFIQESLFVVVDGCYVYTVLLEAFGAVQLVLFDEFAVEVVGELVTVDTLLLFYLWGLWG